MKITLFIITYFTFILKNKIIKYNFYTHPASKDLIYICRQYAK